MISGDVLISMVKEVEFRMVYCSAGTFIMGGDDEYDGKPRHRVEITRPFLMGQTLVTQAQWEVLMGDNPSHLKGAHLPVEEVTWFDCVELCNALSEAEGFSSVYKLALGEEPIVEIDWESDGYRLPTGAEWEYAAKAGTELAFAGSDSVDEVAWYKNNSGFKTRSVAQKKPNTWNLYDMSGNVFEWSNDEWAPDRFQSRTGTTRDPRPFGHALAPRVYRGGDLWVGSEFCRVAYRGWNHPYNHGDQLGLRFLRSNIDT